MKLFEPFEGSVPAAGSPVAAPPSEAGVHLGRMPHARGSEIFITVRPLPGAGIPETFQRLAAALKEWDAAIVHLLVFGRVDAAAAGAEAMRRIFGGIEWPVTWVEGAPGDDGPLAGVQAFAFAGGSVEPLRLGGRVAGSVYEDGAFRHCVLGGVGPQQPGLARADQTRQTLDRLAEALDHGGFSFADVARTWFFLDRLLLWYGEFNQARNRVYSGIKFRAGALPASTGIGARNPAGMALVAGAWALRPLMAGARGEPVVSPLQCPAPAYGSAFSRAMEISSPAGCRLSISGTASIGPDGRTLWPDDARRQVAETMRVVEALLLSRGFFWPDLTRATAYFKHGADAGLLREWCTAQGRGPLPAVLAQAEVCRDDLRFELELDAWRAR